MKHVSRLLSLLVAVMVLLTSFAAAEAAPAADDPVLFTFDGEAYTKSQVDESLQNLMANGYLDSASDYDTAIEYMIQDRVIEEQIAKQGLDQYTNEEKAAFLIDAQKEWDSLLDDYVSYYLTEDTDEARAEARSNAEALYASYGYSVESIQADLMMQDGYERLQNSVYGDADVTVTDAQIQELFDEYAEQDKEMYENNVYMYELYKNYGQESWYRPEGYRGIIHILLNVDDTLLNAYQEAQNAYEESLSNTEGATADSEALKNVADAARQAVLDSEKAAIDDIYARLAKGESFESLIGIYGEDDGMKDEEYLKNGYEVHKESIMWDPAFVDAAFQDKMAKPGDVSDPVVGANGIHILYYLRDIPSGKIDITPEIRELISNYLVDVAHNDLFSAAMEGWIGAHEIVYNQEAIESAKATAAAVPEDIVEGEEEAAEGEGEEMTEEEWQQLIQQLQEQGFTIEEGAAEETADDAEAPADAQ